LLKRTLIGAGVLGVVLGAWALDRRYFAGAAPTLGLIATVVTLGSLIELLRIGSCPRRQRHVGVVAGLLWIGAMAMAGAASGPLAADGSSRAQAALVRVGDLLAAGSALAGLYLAIQLRRGPDPGTRKLARSLWFAVPYACGLSALVALLVAGRVDYVLGVVLTCKSSDIGAYFTGKSIGRRKLAPRISPNKTVEGALGGLVLPAIVGAFLLHEVVLTVAPDGTPTLLPGGRLGAAAHGLVLGLLTIVSDLSESLLKRSCEVKDSGTVFGESGGFLDLADSLLLVAPIALAYTAVSS
jgi:phosphatidate cytidylyltransferase